MKYLSPLLCATLLAACGNPSEVTPTRASIDVAGGGQPPLDMPGIPQERSAIVDNTFEGKVTGIPLNVKETIFLLGAFEETTVRLPVLVVVQSDTPGLCAHLQNGTLPKNATLFPMALIQQDGEKVAAPRSYSPPNPTNPASTANFFTVSQFRKLDAACNIVPDSEAGVGKAGEVILQTLEPDVCATGEYALLMGDQEDVVRGSFVATFCEAPAFFNDLEGLLTPVVDGSHCL